MQLDKHLTQWQLYHMALEPNFEPLLPLIVLHDHAYPELLAWYAQYQATGEFGEIPEPAEPEPSGWFARKGKLPSLQQVDIYMQERQASVQHSNIETDSLSAEQPRDSAASVDTPVLPSVEDAPESFDDSVTLGFDWRVVKRAGIALVVCVALVAAGDGGVHWYEHVQQQRDVQAQADCQASVQLVQDRQRAWQRLVDAASTKQALAYSEQDIADKQVLTKLRNAAQPPKITSRSCAGDTVSALQDVTHAHTALADTLTHRTSVLRKAVKTAVSSHRKQLDGQRGELQVGINGAQALLDSSSGNVADDATRDALAQAIAQARSVYQDNNVSDIQSYITAGKSLVDAQAAVQASIDAKAQADEQAKQQAAQDAQPQAATPSPHYVTAPRQTAPSTPQRTAPAAPQAPTPPTWSVPAPSSNPLPDSDGSL